MSKGYNESGVFVDTGLLRDHVSKLREEKKTVTRLYENVAAMRELSDPTVSYEYEPILRDILQLMEYFDRMAKLLDNTGDDAQEVSHKISALIDYDTENARHTNAKSFML